MLASIPDEDICPGILPDICFVATPDSNPNPNQRSGLICPCRTSSLLPSTTIAGVCTPQKWLMCVATMEGIPWPHGLRIVLLEVLDICALFWPLGIGKNYQWTIAKCVLMPYSRDEKLALGNSQLCASFEGGINGKKAEKHDSQLNITFMFMLEQWRLRFGF